METIFALIITAQYWENYGAHDWNGIGDCPQHWKPKGGIEHAVRENLSLSDVMALGADGLRELAMAAYPTSNNYCDYSGLDYELVELTSTLVNQVQEYINSNDSLYLSYDPYAYIAVAIGLNIHEYAANWAMDQLGLLKQTA